MFIAFRREIRRNKMGPVIVVDSISNTYPKTIHRSILVLNLVSDMFKEYLKAIMDRSPRDNIAVVACCIA